MKKSISSVFLSATKKSLLFLAIVMAAVMLCAAAPALDQSENGLRTKAYAYTGWDEDGSYWYYYNDDIPASGWQEIYHNGQWDWYYFIDGCMQTGWLDWDGSWFYLRDSYGQNVGFSNDSYGTCVYGWEEIYHSGRWDYYHFSDHPSGRLNTNWLDSDGYTYYLCGSEIGTSYYSSDYGTMIIGLHTIGAYQYFFKDDNYSYAYPASTYPHGAMVRNCSNFVICNNGVVLGYANIDSNGHVDFTQILREEGEEVMDNGEDAGAEIV